MYKTSNGNPYTPDIDITQLAVVLNICKSGFIPAKLLENTSIRNLLTDLVSKEYITKEEYHNVEDTFWHLTEKGKNRIEVYYHYVTIKPEILNHFKPNPENQLRAIKQLSQNMTNLRYRNYTFSYEACLVYQLNNP
jgi:predicted transcriptional regulator